MHNVSYAKHPGYQKMIEAIRDKYYWPRMKKHVDDLISICMECQKVNVEKTHPVGLLYPLPLPEWKWEIVTIYFITKLPKTTR